MSIHRATKQQEVFAQQVELAKKYELTLVIHTRDAWDDTFAILQNEGAPKNTVIHCFTGGIERSKKMLLTWVFIFHSAALQHSKTP